MASDPFEIWDEQQFSVNPGEVTAGVPFDLAVSDPVTNVTPRPSVVVNVTYADITPDITDGSPPFQLCAVVEYLNGNNQWQPLMYQFNGIRNSQDPARRILRMQPDISDFNQGIDDCVYIINAELARISRQQGFMPDTQFRVKIILVDNDPTGENHFVSAKVSCSGERYDHL